MMKRILVCDDERHIAHLIASNFKRQGYDTVVVYDGRRAIEELEKGPFDRVILDLMMPYLDGFEVLKWIRTHEEHKDTWVALMTAQADELQVMELEYRADYYIKKPVDDFKWPWQK